jgi:hypothetical protein
MNITFRPQSTNKNGFEMNTQSGKNRKTNIITIFLGMFLILVGGGLLVANSFGSDVMGPTIMFLFALCFIVVAVWSKKNLWAIIPGGIFATIGLVAGLEILIPQSGVTGPVFLLLSAATFIAFAILSKKNWWAIIPGGIFASLGLVVVLDILVPHEAYPSLPGMLTWGFYTWVLFLGLAITFGVLWLRRKTLPTTWAKYPAAGCLAIAVLFILEGALFSEYWLATMLLVFGVMLLLVALSRKRTAAG